MARLVDSLLRGRAQPSARLEAAAALSDIRSFVRAWRPNMHGHGASGRRETGAGRQRGNEDMSGGGVDDTTESSRSATAAPTASTLLKLAQRGVQLHNNARKLPPMKPGNSADEATGNEWKAASISYIRAVAASLVSLGSTSSPKDCANMCRLFAKAGDMLVDEAGDDIRALEMFDDAEECFNLLPEFYYGGGQRGPRNAENLSLSAEDLVMAMQKAFTRRIEVISRTSGNVDQVRNNSVAVRALELRSSHHPWIFKCISMLSNIMRGGT
ncbi:unnamed protein product [Sphacelaria rigidula]